MVKEIPEIEELSSSLRNLDKLIGDTSIICDPEAIVKQIEKITCVERVDSARLALFNYTLFHSTNPPDLLHFLQETTTPQNINIKDLAKVRKLVLSFIANYINCHSTLIKEHCSAILDTAFNVFKKEKDSMVKESSLKPIKRLITHRLIDNLISPINEIAEWLLRDLRIGKSSQSVNGKVYHVLGMLVEYYPKEMESYIVNITDLLLKCISKNFTIKNPKFQELGGSIKGISNILSSEKNDLIISNKNTMKSLYENIFKTAISIPSGLSRYYVQYSALKLITIHCSLFQEYITHKSQYMFKLLLLCCEKQSVKLQRLGFPAIESFITCLSERISILPQEEAASLLNYYNSSFLGLLQDSNSEMNRRIGITGIREMCIPLSKYSPNLLYPCLLKIYNCTQLSVESNNNNNTNNNSNNTYDYSSRKSNNNILLAYANIINILNDERPPPSQCLDHMKTLITSQLLSLPYMISIDIEIFSVTILKLLISVYKWSDIEYDFREFILTNSLLSTIRYSPEGSDISESKYLYNPYIFYWKDMMDIMNGKTQTKYISKEEDLKILNEIYSLFCSKIIETMNNYINTLDLSYTVEDFKNTENTFNNTAINTTTNSTSTNTNTTGSGTSSNSSTNSTGTATTTTSTTTVVSNNDSYSIKFTNPIDYLFFTNLCNFNITIYPMIKFNILFDYIPILGRLYIQKSHLLPMIIGFYQLIKLVFELCNRMKYFTNVETHSEKYIKVYINILNRKQCLDYFTVFLNELLLSLTQYQSEVLINILHTLLAAPIECLSLNSQIEIIIKGFEIGGYNSSDIMESVLNMTEKLIQSNKIQSEEDYYRLLQPLHNYLIIKDESEDEVVKEKASKSSKQLDKVIKSSIGNRSLQHRILLLLGHIGGNNRYIIPNIKEIIPKYISWDPLSSLNIQLVCDNIKTISFPLTIIIPRVLDLAKKSTNRQIKVASSEFLHSVIVYIIGDSMNSTKTVHGNILKPLFSGLLQLSVDLESISKQLFQPLTMQLIHWFSSGRGNEEDTIILIDCITEALGDKTNGALRNYGSVAYSEFLKWSIKQRSSRKIKLDIIQFDSLLRRLLLLCTHSDPYKRLGAVTTFSMIYRTYREELQLIDLFCLEILMTLLLSLRLSHLDKSGMTTNKKCIEAISHCKKIILKREVLNTLKQTNKERNKYINGINEITPILLEGVSSGETDYRRECIDLFTQIETNPKVYISNYIREHSIKGFRELIEGDILTPFDIGNNNNTTVFNDIMKWLSRFGGILDCYQWLIQMELCDISLLFQPDNSNDSKKRNNNGDVIESNEICHVLDYCSYFLTMFPSSSSNNNNTISFSELFPSCSPNQIDQIGQLRAECFRRLYGFLSSILVNYPMISLNNIINELLMLNIWYSIVNPKVLGFLEFWHNSNTPLLASAHLFTQALVQSQYSYQIKTYFNNKLNELLPVVSEWNIKHLPDSLFACHRLIKGLVSLGKIGLFTNINNIEEYGSKLVVQVFSLSKDCSDEMYVFAGELLSLSYYCGFKLNIPNGLLDTMISCSDDIFQNNYLHSEISKEWIKLFIIEDKCKDNISYLFCHITTHFNRICIILTAVLNYLSSLSLKTQQPPQQQLISSITAANYFKDIWIDTFPQLLTVASSTTDITSLKILIQIISATLKLYPITTLPSSCWSSIYSSLQKFMKQPDLNPTNVKMFLDLVPYVIRGIVNTSKVTYTLDSIQNNEYEDNIYDLLLIVAEKFFPLNTSELTVGSVLYIKYTTTLQNLLLLLIQTGSPLLFDLLRLTCNEENHIDLNNIISSFIHLSKSIKHDKTSVLILLHYYINLLTNSSDAIHYIQLLHKYIIFPLLLKLDNNLLLDIITTPYIEDNSNKVSLIQYALNIIEQTLPMTDYQSLLPSKIFSFKLLSVIYDVLTPEQIRKDLCQHYAGVNSKGNEITRLLCSKGRQSAVTKAPEDKLYKEYTVYAFDCLATVVRNTQTEQKFYDGLVFKEDQMKGECLWDNIAPNVSLEFEVETEYQSEEWKNVISNMRSSYTKPNSSSLSTQSFLSQYLVGSSLASQLESNINKNETNNQKIGNNNNNNAYNNYIELDPINSSYSMIAVLQIIDHVYLKFSSNWVNPPIWLDNWIIKLADSSTSLQTRFFIMKIILNRPKLFSKYSQHLVIPLIQCLLDIDKENNKNNSFHYIMRDLCLILCDWDINFGSSIRLTYVASFINHLIQCIPYTRQSIVLCNVKILKNLLSKWSKYIPELTLDYSLPLSLLDKEDGTFVHIVKRSGLLLFGCFLQLNCEIIGPVSSFDVSTYIKGLMTSIKSNIKDEYLLASEIAALSIKQYEFKLSELPQRISQYLTELFSERNYDKFSSIINKCICHYPELLNHSLLEYSYTMLSSNNVQGTNRINLYESVHNEMYKDSECNSLLKRIIPQSIRDSDSSVILYILDQFKVFLPILMAKEEKEYMCYFDNSELSIIAIKKHENESIRIKLYELLIWFYKELKEDRLKNVISEIILSGLNDDSDKVEEMIFSFLDENYCNNESHLNRLYDLLTKLPLDKCQDNWIKYSTPLLLKLYSHIPNYKNELFHSPSECEYKPISINSSWTQSQLSQDSIMAIRNTQSQSAFWSQSITQIGEEGFIYNPTQSAMEILNAPLLYNTQRNQPFSSGYSGNNQQQQIPNDLESALMPPPKMRFRKGQMNSDNYILLNQQQKRKERSHSIIETEEMNKRVKLYRSYRDGELPDLNISLSDIIDPLIALVQRDPILSNLVFEKYISSLYNDGNEVNKNNEKYTELLNKLSEQINILYTSPSFVNALFTMIQVFQPTKSLNYSYLTTIALNTKVINNGILVLETILQNPNNRISVDDRINIWCQLYKLYQNLDERDLLLTIQTEWCSKLLTTKALDYEMQGNYSDALNTYEECLDNLEENNWEDGIVPNVIETDCWYKERLHCMFELQQWDNLLDNINSEVDNNVNELWNNENQYMIPYYIKSLLRKGGEDSLILLTHFINNSNNNISQLFHMLPIDLATFHYLSNDLDRCLARTDEILDLFLEEWSSLHQLSTKSKLTILEQLQRISELRDIINTERECNRRNECKDEIENELIRKWNNTFPKIIEDKIDTWEGVIYNRKCYNDRLCNIFPHLEDSLIKTIYKGYKNALNNGCTSVAQLYIKEYSEYEDDNNIKELKAFEGVIDILKYKALKNKDYKLIEKCKSVLETKDWGSIDLNSSNDELSKEKYIKYNMISGSVLYTSLVLCDEINKDEINNTLYSISKCYNNALESVGINKKDESKLRYEYGLFCDYVLNSEKIRINENSRKEYIKLYIENIMKSIINGNEYARNYILRIFEYILENDSDNNNNELLLLFEKYNVFPQWYYLKWESQLIGLLNTKLCDVIINIFENLCEYNSQSLVYAIMVSEDNLNEDVKIKLNKVKSKLKFGLFSRIVNNFAELHHPHLRVLDILRQVSKLVYAKNHEKAKKLMKLLYSDIVDGICDMDNGKYNTNWKRQLSVNLKKDFGNNVNNLKPLAVELIDSVRREVYILGQKPPLGLNIKRGNNALIDYSLYLSNYCDYGSEKLHINVFGCNNSNYNNLSPDLIEDKYIVSFNPYLLVMESKQLPKRIIIRGNDYNEYKYLVKGGEDLRLDSRIEEMFMVINNILKKNNECKEKNLLIKTYNVVAMTPFIGLLEWVNNTIPLSSIIENQYALRKKVDKITTFQFPAMEKYRKWLKTNYNDKYSLLYAKSNLKDIEDNYKECVKLCSNDLLNEYIKKLSIGCESYLVNRNELMKDLSVINVSNYILGIGDRHLGNFLLDIERCSLVSIDFGCSFGFGTQLPIPETIPIRLTPELMSIFKPFDSKNVMELIMSEIMYSLSDEKELLLRILDIFLKDPLINWEDRVEKTSSSSSSSNNSNNSKSNNKLKIVERKLNNENPINILISELKGRKEYPKGIENILLHNNSITGEYNDVKKQIHTLVELSSDNVILGIQYYGLTTWL